MADKKHVLVTGLSGLVGTALRSDFEDRYELSSLSRYGTDGMDDSHNFKGNIAELDTIIPAFEGQHTVVHLAADRSANANWESALRNNFVGVYNVYEAAKRTGVKRVVFGSSQHAIGGFYQDEPYKTILAGKFDQVKRPFKLIDETVPIRPDGYYGASKAYAEGLGSYYSEFHGISSINIRIGWTISNDNPTSNGGGLAMWLSHRDTAQIHVKAVDAPDLLMYTVVFAMSNNYWNIFSLEKARKVLGYEPQDDAGKVLDPTSKMLERDDTDFKQHPDDPDSF
ncbi:MAG: NAD(P)-dependent oxidoreductase [Dehalococcoidia bacterium]|jgi:nucleoside-diphosphate-sugar epimerase|nr:NAD(P)-dependent oxidoreductase [Dehalococcoidia bacterium]|tara:strand:+ start:3151 stop:3996 length:846 start_codon:yes stop_codon:yes gene_type:complete